MTKRGTRKLKRDYETVTVPFAATPTRETPSIERWAHSTVWTERMLTTLLENKVRGGKWHTLYDKVMSRQNLYFSAMKVTGKKGAAGVDQQTVDEFLEQRWPELDQLQQESVTESCKRLWCMYWNQSLTIRFTKEASASDENVDATMHFGVSSRSWFNPASRENAHC